MKKLSILIYVLLTGYFVQAQDATEIVRESYEKVNGTSSYIEMTMEIVRPNWTRSISMKTWALGMDYSMV